MKTLIFTFALLGMSHALFAFDITHYRKTLIAIDNQMEAVHEDVVALSQLSDFFSDENAEYQEYLISKFNNTHNFVGADIYEMQHLLTVNQKLVRKLITIAKNHPNSMIEIASNVVLINQAQLFFNQFYHADGRVRRVLKAALKSIVIDDERVHKWRNDVEVIEDLAHDNKFFLSLEKISKSDNRELAKIISDKKIKAKDINFGNHGYVDSFFGAINGTYGYVNSLMTNIVGDTRTRNGRLFNNDQMKLILKHKLKPLDVLMCSSPFTLAGLAIPGRFDHGAIYLGTEAQLKEIGMWNNPSIIPYHADIEAGRVILDNVRSGVKLNDLEHFLNIDEVLVMRRDHELEDIDRMAFQYKIGLEQVGKKYNYTFDILKLNKLLFTELIYLVYNTDEFPNRKRLGHLTMYPNDIVKILFKENSPFKMILYIEGSKNNQLNVVDKVVLQKRI